MAHNVSAQKQMTTIYKSVQTIHTSVISIMQERTSIRKVLDTRQS